MIGNNKLIDKSAEVSPIAGFWNWFKQHNQEFKNVYTNQQKAHKFLKELIDKMGKIHPSLQALAGKYDEEKFELVITADGEIAVFAKVEEVVKAAPEFSDWIVTAHKPAIGQGISISMYGFEFNEDNLHFYPLLDDLHPDEINIIVVHKDYTEELHEEFFTATMLYLDNALGEIKTATVIDLCDVGIAPANTELIPITKLDAYLNWRQKEFLEKYENLETTLPEEEWSVIEARDNKGLPLFATINLGFEEWEYKAAYPWNIQIKLEYKGIEEGLPGEEQMADLQIMEDEIIRGLENNITIHLGHETNDNTRTIFFYTSDYLTTSKALYELIEVIDKSYKPTFTIYKDKYWQELDFYFNSVEAEDEEEGEDEGEDEEDDYL